MGKIVGGVDAPFGTSAVMRLAKDAVSDDVPHGRVGGIHVLLHAQRHLAWLVLARLHVGELGKGLLDGLGAILGEMTRTMVLAAALSLDLLG